MLSILQGIPSDQLTAMGCQLLSLMSGVLFYHVFHTKYSSTNTRHLISLTIGLTVAILCYKTSFIHLLLLCLLSYTVLLYVPVGFRGWLTFALCFGHVLLVHLDSYVNHYMEFRVEISNSLMVLASKVSYTAFSLDDNFKRSKLTPNQVKYKLTATPTFFEYFSYCFCFLGILFGPCYHFSEYMSFIRGDQYKEKWPARRAFKMLLVALTCLLLHFIFSQQFSAQYNLSPAVADMPFLKRHVILWLTMFLARCKYYFGWLSSESICHLSGLGYDISTDSEWKSAIPTVRVLGVEVATSLKVFSDNWNIFTARWLHFCIYERVPQYKVHLVFICSAVWHGFYPGYYMMFGPLAGGVLLGRKVRQTIRPIFQQSNATKLIYDVITCFATIIVIAFNSCAFELKDWQLIYQFQRSLYFWPHLVLLIGLILVPNKKSIRQPKLNGNQHQSHLS